VARDSSYAPPRVILAQALAEQGRFDEAIEQAKRAVDLGDTPFAIAVLGYIDGEAGRLPQAREMLGRLERFRGEKLAHQFAILYMALGERQKALDMLQKSLEDREEEMCWVNVDIFFRGLHEEPRFQAILRRLNLVPEPLHVDRAAGRETPSEAWRSLPDVRVRRMTRA